MFYECEKKDSNASKTYICSKNLNIFNLPKPIPQIQHPIKFGKNGTNNNLDKAIKNTCSNNVNSNQLQKTLTLI